MAKPVLYYPHIGFKNPALVKALALYYTSIYRIVPNGIVPDDAAELAPLLEDQSIGVMIDPVPYSKRASKEFLEKRMEWDAAALIASSAEEAGFAQVHADKMDRKVRSLFEEAGFRRDGDWMHISTALASNLMLYLAKSIADANGLDRATSEWGAWTATSYFECDGAIDLSPDHEEGAENHDGSFRLFGLMLNEMVPLNIAAIPAEKVAEFRARRQTEIEAFHDSLDELKSEISKIESGEVSEEKIRSKARELARAMSDFRRSASNLKAEGWFGSKMLAIPGLAYLGSLLAIPQTSTAILGATGVALGGLFSISKTREKLQELRRKSQCSILVDLQREFRNYTQQRGGGDMNYHAWNCMEEYIND